MPQIIQHAKIRGKLLGLFLVLAVAGIVGGVFGAYKLYQAFLVKADNQEYATLESLNYELRAQRKYDQAAASWLDYAGRTPNRTHRYQAYLYAAALYVSNREYPNAAKAVKKAEAAGGVTLPEAELAATTYRALGDKAAAIHYYQECVKLVPHTSIDYSAQVKSFEDGIQQLQGGGQ